jgi:protein O-mannosyl-transferase
MEVAREAGRSHQRWFVYLLAVVPCAAAVLAHGPGLHNRFTNWDDPTYVLANPLTVSPLEHGPAALLTGEGIGYPIPATIVAYWLQRRWFADDSQRFGLDPGGFHLVSLALHALAALLVGAIARRYRAPGIGAAVAAALFAVHPLTVEPVAWVVGQKDVLATVLVLAAVWVRAGPRSTGMRASAITAVLVVLALAAKPSAVAAPALLAVVDLSRGRRLRDGLGLYATTALVAGADVALALAGHDQIAPATRVSGASLAEAAWAVGLHVGHVVWPHPLLPRYFAPAGPALWLGAALGCTVLAAAATALVVACRRRAAAGVLAIGGALFAYLPAAGILPLTRGPADSYTYLPLALAVIGLAPALGWLWQRTAAADRTVVAVIAAGLIGGAGLAARQQTRIWRDSVQLWTSLARVHPNQPRALMRVGDAYLFEGRPDAARRVFAELDRRFPDFAAPWPAYADALVELGRPTEAEAVLAKAARADLTPERLEHYGWVLLGTTGLAPSDGEIARAAVVHLAPLLAARGKRPASLERAAALLDHYGESALAARVRRRLDVLVGDGSARRR